MSARVILIAASAFGALAVILGAFGAHGLNAVLASHELVTFSTAVRYQMWHSVVLLFLALIVINRPSKLWLSAAALMGLGIVLFSGSLYFLALGGPRWLGPITPVGGMCFILGWLLIVVGAFRSKL